MSDNPYAAPRADLRPPGGGPIGASGSIAAGLEGRYELGVRSVLREGWELTRGAKLPLLLAAVVTLAVSWLLGRILDALGLSGEALFAQGDYAGGMMMSYLGGIIAWPVTVPLTAGLLMMGVRRAAGAKVELGELFGYFHRTPGLLGLTLLSTVILAAGLFLLVIPFVYLSVAYVLAMQLVLDKGMGVWEALETSRKAITRHWLGAFGLMVVLFVVLTLSTIPLLLGLVWTLPWAIVTLGVLYRRVFGVEPATVAGSRSQPSSAPGA